MSTWSVDETGQSTAFWCYWALLDMFECKGRDRSKDVCCTAPSGLTHASSTRCQSTSLKFIKSRIHLNHLSTESIVVSCSRSTAKGPLLISYFFFRNGGFIVFMFSYEHRLILKPASVWRFRPVMEGRSEQFGSGMEGRAKEWFRGWVKGRIKKIWKKNKEKRNQRTFDAHGSLLKPHLIVSSSLR